MSLTPPPPACSHRGFPRVSGDEPDTTGQSGGENRFSPRERG